jgi:molybdopterin-guanine dinucleotide biosynthesis protein B
MRIENRGPVPYLMPMVKIVCVTGSKKSGKTSLVTKLVEAMIRRGYRVGVIKSSHEDVDLDTPGTDTWKFREAGAERVMLAGHGRAAVTHFSLEETSGLQHVTDLCMADLDLVLAEGFKRSPYTKIFVAGGDEIEINSRGLIATVGMGEGTRGVPDYDRDDISGIVECIENRFHWNEGKERAGMTSGQMSIDLRADGRKIGMKGFVRDILAGAVVGMVRTLKGCAEAKKIEITISLEDDESAEPEDG